MAWRLASSVYGVSGRAYVHVYDTRSRKSSILHPRKPERASPVVHSHHDSSDPGAGDSRRGETDRRPCAGTAQQPAAAEAHSRGPTESRRQRRRSQTNKSHQSNHRAVSQLELGKFARGAGPSDASEHQHQHSRTGRSTTATTAATTGPGRHGKERDRGGSRLPDGDVAARRINQAILDASAGRQYESILQLVADHGAAMGGVNAATALHQLGSCGLEPGGKEARRLLADPRFRQLERLAETHLPSLTGREAANCLWALAKLGYRSSILTSSNDSRSTSIRTARSGVSSTSSTSSSGMGVGAAPPPGANVFDDSNSQGAGGSRAGGSRAGGAAAAAAAATNNVSGSQAAAGLLVELCGRVEAVVSTMRSQEAANALWALGTLGHFPGEALLRGLNDRLLAVLSEARPQEVSNSLLGLAKLGWSPGPGVLDQVAHGSLDKIPDFKAQELSNTLWALSRFGHRHDQLQAAIFQQTWRRASEFKPEELASLLFAAAMLGLHIEQDADGGRTSHGAGAQRPGLIPGALLRRCCDQAVTNLARYGSQELSNLLWAVAKLGYRHEPLLRASANLAARGISASVVAVRSSATGLQGGAAVAPARSPYGGDRASGGAVSEVWTSQPVASIVWSYATLGCHPGLELLQQVCRHVSCRARLSEYDMSEVVHTVWSLAVLGHHDPPALAAVEAEVLARLASAAGPEPTAAAAAAAAASSPGEGAAVTHGTRSSLSPAGLANLLWAFASLGHSAPGLFGALLPLLERRLPEFSTEAISNSVWAAARLGVYDPRVMDAVAEHVCTHRLQQLRPPEIASLAWAYGELGHVHTALLTGLASCTVSYVWPRADSSVTLGVLAAVCGAAGLMGTSHPALHDAAAKRVAAYAQQLLGESAAAGPAPAAGPRSAAGAAEEVGRLSPPSTQTSVSTRMDARAAKTRGRPTASPAEAAEGATVVGVGAGPGSRDGGARAVEEPSLELPCATDIANLAQALSLAGGCSPAVWSQLVQLMGRAAGDAPGDDHQARLDGALAQLYQAYLHVKLDYPAAPLDPGPPGLLERAARALRLRAAAGPGPLCALQQEVSEALERLGLGQPIAVLTDDGLFRVDLALEVEVEVQAAARGPRGLRGHPGRAHPEGRWRSTSAPRRVRVAVEADGPSHFTANTRQPLGTTLYRRRCLAARGWVVVSVPYWRWQQAAGGSPSSVGRDALLAELLREAGLGEALAVQPAAAGSKEKKQTKSSVRSRVAGGHLQLQREQNGGERETSRAAPQ